MKLHTWKLLFCALLAGVLLASAILPAAAAPVLPLDTPASEERIDLADGSYIIVTCRKIVPEGDVQTASTTITGETTHAYHSEDGEILLRMTVKGTFEVNPGVSAVCTHAEYSYEILASGWKLDSASAWADGNRACATGLFKKKLLFLTTLKVQLKPVTICDIYGNISRG